MPTSRPGALTVFLGYAAGVGKTYRMLLEGERALREGRDVVMGYFEPHARQDTMALAAGFETLPRRRTQYRGHDFEEMDTDAILRRAPQVCLVDEFAHTNVPGSRHGKRWQDVQLLLAAGVDVFTTLNVQHLESLNDQVFQISGVRVRETVPDWVMRQAGELVMVDLSTRALLNRLQRGAIYEPGKAQAAMANFFREPTLVALRELALRQTAHEIEVRRPETAQLPVPGAERILVHVTAEPNSVMILRRASRVANFLRAECYAVCVDPPGLRPSPAAERHLEFARNLRIDVHRLTGAAPAQVLVEFARRHAVTQIFLARPQPTPAARAFVARLVELARDRQVIIVAERR